MIRIFKWWWAWDYEKIEDWLEKMESSGLRLIDTRMKGIFFYFEKCRPSSARYCIDYQTKLTPEYTAIITDDGWNLYQLGMGWYILRKEYKDERPDLYTDFEALIARNKVLLTLISVLLLIEIVCFGNMIWDVYRYYSVGHLAYVCILGSVIVSFFSFAITNLAMQISKFRKMKL